MNILKSLGTVVTIGRLTVRRAGQEYHYPPDLPGVFAHGVLFVRGDNSQISAHPVSDIVEASAITEYRG
jgi:hypothetical protein